MPGERVPNLPGHKVNFDNRTDFPKSHIFDVQNGIPMPDLREVNQDIPPKEQALIGNRKAPFLDTRNTPIDGASKSVWSDDNTANVPAGQIPKWIEYSGHVLRFYGYFKEPVFGPSHSMREKLRVRNCIFFYFLQDGSIQVVEEKVTNSGMPQGMFLKKHLCPREDRPGYIDHTDFRVGEDIVLYGRTFHIRDADPYTRKTCQLKWAVTLGPAEEIPSDTWTEVTKESKKATGQPTHKKAPFIEFSECARGVPPRSTFIRENQMLRNDRKVLRFWGCWHDTSNAGGKKFYRLQYYLADDTLEIEEDKHRREDGTGNMSMFVRRSKMPKRVVDSNSATIGNDPEYDDTEYTHYRDLAIGGYVNVFGRQMLLTKADRYTIDFYKKVLGKTEKDFVEIAIPDPVVVIPERPIPPPTGYGTEEDSLGSFKSLVPRPPPKDTTKSWKYGMFTLKWRAKLVSTNPTDQGRKFVLTYWMADEGVMVYEEAVRNSGFSPGKFMEKAHIKNPATGKFYQPEDFVVGQEIIINGWHFTIHEADGSTTVFLANGKQTFSNEDLGNVLRKMAKNLFSRNARKSTTFRSMDDDFSNSISSEEVRQECLQMGWRLRDEDAATLFTAFDPDMSGAITPDEFLCVLEKIVVDDKCPPMRIITKEDLAKMGGMEARKSAVSF